MKPFRAGVSARGHDPSKSPGLSAGELELLPSCPVLGALAGESTMRFVRPWRRTIGKIGTSGEDRGPVA